MMKPVFYTQSQRKHHLQESVHNCPLSPAVSHPPTRNHHPDSATRRHSPSSDHSDHDQKKRKREDEAKVLTPEQIRQMELQAIKEQYLGLDHKPKRRIPKHTERFNSKWPDSDDTSPDSNPLYQNPHQAQILFGRGFLGGVDRRVQKNAANEWANRRWSEKVLDEMTERDWRIFKEDNSISYKGTKVPRPMRTWSESNLHNDLLKAVEKAGYKEPTPIQMASIPLGLQQRDVIGVAQTGSGKTAAFVLPMLNYIAKLPRISNRNRDQGPYALVMAPTRELAQQIEEETVKLGRYLGIKVVSAVGGQPIQEQAFKISQGCEILIAAPGRLLDLLSSRLIVLNQCNYVVLDEADRMIDMGFSPQVEGVLDAMPSSNLKPENEDEVLDEKKIYRTTYMFSATMSVEKLARKYLRNPVIVNIGTPGQATDDIEQVVVMLKESEKWFALKKLLYKIFNESKSKGTVDPKILVFCNTKRTVDSLFKDLDTEGYGITALHSAKSQEQREASLDSFRTKRTNVLIATDVAGRGLDIPNIAHVINYDMSGDIEKYTHRIGRTGRAGKKGVATTFLTLQDSNVFYDLKRFLIQSKSEVPPALDRHEASKFKPGSIPDRPPKRNDKVFARY